MAKTGVFVAVAFALLLPNAESADRTSLALARSSNAAPTTWTFGRIDFSLGIDSSYGEADDSAADADERQPENVGESDGSRYSEAVAPLAIASILAINQGDLAPIEPTLVISIHAPPTVSGLLDLNQ